MARLTKQDVLHVAGLAKLNLTDSEVQKFTEQLSSIVDLISQLADADIKGVEPTSQTTGLENVLREDKIVEEQSLNADQAISGTDETYNGYFKVAAILSERSDK